MTELATGKTFELTVTKQYDMQILADTITTAIEGGIGYWSLCTEYKWQDREPHEVLAKVEIEPELKDEEDEDEYLIDCSVVQRGLKRLLDGSVQIDHTIMGYIHQSLGDNDAGMIDAIAADCIVQAGLFNEVRYG